MQFVDLVLLHCVGGLGNPCYGVQARLVNFALHFQECQHFSMCQSKATLPMHCLPQRLKSMLFEKYLLNSITHFSDYWRHFSFRINIGVKNKFRAFFHCYFALAVIFCCFATFDGHFIDQRIIDVIDIAQVKRFQGFVLKKKIMYTS